MAGCGRMTPLLIGIDPGSTTGLAVINPSGKLIEVIRLDGAHE